MKPEIVGHTNPDDMITLSFQMPDIVDEVTGVIISRKTVAITTPIRDIVETRLHGADDGKRLLWYHPQQKCVAREFGLSYSHLQCLRESQAFVFMVESMGLSDEDKRIVLGDSSMPERAKQRQEDNIANAAKQAEEALQFMAKHSDETQDIFLPALIVFLNFCKENDIPFEFNDELEEGKLFLFIHVNKDTVKKLGINCKNPDTVDEWMHYKEVIQGILDRISTEELQALFIGQDK